MMLIRVTEWVPEGPPSREEMEVADFAEAHSGMIDVSPFGDVHAAVIEGVRVFIDWSGKYMASRDDIRGNFRGQTMEEVLSAALEAKPDAPDPVCPDCGAKVRAVSRGRGNFERWVQECTKCDWQGFDQALYAWNEREAHKQTLRERAGDRHLVDPMLD